MWLRGFALLLAAMVALPVHAAEDLPALARQLDIPAAELSASRRPAEMPPPDFTAQQYIDSDGCVFMRVDRIWHARIARDGSPICGYPPTLSARRTPGTGPALFPQNEEPRAARIERTLVEAIIPNLESGELAAPAGMGSASPGPGLGATPGPADRVQTANAPADPAAQQLGRMLDKTSAVRGALVGAHRAARLCALVGGEGAVPGAAGTEICGPALPDADHALLRRNAGAPVAGAGTVATADAGARETGSASNAATNSPADRTAAANRGSAAARTDAARSAAAADPKQAARRAPPRQGIGAGPGMIPPGARYVQIGAFNEPANAERAARQLVGMGLPVVRSRTDKAAPQIIMVGPLDGREAIVRTIDRVRRAGYGDAYAR